MQTVLSILAICAAGFSLLLSIAVTAVLIIFVLKLKKIGFFTLPNTEEDPKDEHKKENDDLAELIRINYQIVQDLEKSDERTAMLLGKLEETDRKLSELFEKRNTAENCNKIAELEGKLTAENAKNKELSARISELEAEKPIIKSESDYSESARERIMKLEELVNYKDQYYAEVLNSEQKLRAGVCDAIDSLIRTRGSNSTEYLEEQIETVIKLLNDSRTKNK